MLLHTACVFNTMGTGIARNEEQTAAVVAHKERKAALALREPAVATVPASAAKDAGCLPERIPAHRPDHGC
jgi:hypothetical protein